MHVINNRVHTKTINFFPNGFLAVSIGFSFADAFIVISKYDTANIYENCRNAPRMGVKIHIMVN
jgi:uncharacterized protein with GYD domain